MEILALLEKGIWFGLAALGFGILFNVPRRTLWVIWVLGAIGGLTKVFLLEGGIGVVLASFAGASFIGVLSIQAAHGKHAPPLVFSIPAVIPMVPGAFAYRMMLGFMNLTGDITSENYNELLHQTVNNGLKTLFILMSLAVGVSIPMLATRKESAKVIKLKK
jgi:uncharacterized membrane protein YjjB (DUF3815 family)